MWIRCAVLCRAEDYRQNNARRLPFTEKTMLVKGAVGPSPYPPSSYFTLDFENHDILFIGTAII
jgi:hypothetical protein